MAWPLGRFDREGRDAAGAVGVPRGLGPARDPELAVDVAEVELDRLLADPELAPDLPVREPARHGLEDRGLALAERIGPDYRGGALLGFRAPDGEGGVRQRRAEHRRQVDRLDGLHDVAAGAARAGGVDLLGVAVAREDHDCD